MPSIKIDKRVLNFVINQYFDRSQNSFAEAARDRAEAKFEKVRNKTLEKFEKHKVSTEIEGGPRAGSSFLPVGNLFSFIGFSEGEDPIGDLRGDLAQGMTMEHTPSYDASLKRFSFRVHYLDENDLEEMQRGKLQWSEDGWTKFVEEGIDNLNHYLYSRKADFPQSRSGPAVQIKGEVPSMGGASFGGTPYLSEIITYFRTQF